MSKLKIYGDSISGNCYKIQLACAQLGIEYEWLEMDLMSGAARTEEFRAINPNAKVPLMMLPDGRYLAESNVILCYLAEGTPLLSIERYERAYTMQWLFFEQYSHEPFIATSRFIVKYLGTPAEQQASLDKKKKPGYRALDVMEKHLSGHEFFANDRYSIADIALFAYTHVAHEGGFDLSGYPNINEWLDRVRETDGFVPMKA
jgi:glutathione S-transferase